jgi:branched-chain amino acid transport system ATP-binding protein
MLALSNVVAGYGSATVLFGVSMTVGAGEVVALLGRNGMGKTTTLRAIMGMTPPSAGDIRYGGKQISGLAPNRIARSGIALVPEGRQIFPNLTVDENLVATRRKPGAGQAGWDLASVYEIFPALKERRSNMGNELSGGEQQMLAIGRALLTNPSLLILDEATEGLAPLIREAIWAVIRKIQATGLSILIVDKNLEALADIAHKAYIMEKGRMVWEGALTALLKQEQLQVLHLGI